MPHQVVFTSHIRGVRPGSSGYCTVLHSPEIRPALLKALEEDSVFEHHDGNRGKVVFRFKTLDLRGSQYYVLSRIADVGLDYTGRTNFIAHHLAYAGEEIPEYTPAEILKNWDGWHSDWSGEPRLEAVTEPVVPRELPPVKALGGVWGPLLATHTLQQLRTKSKKIVLSFPGEEPLPLLQMVSDVLAIEALSSGYRPTWGFPFSIGSATKSVAADFLIFATDSTTPSVLSEFEEISARTVVSRDALTPRYLQIAETGAFEPRVPQAFPQPPPADSPKLPETSLDDKLSREIKRPTSQGRPSGINVGDPRKSNLGEIRRRPSRKPPKAALIGSVFTVLIIALVAGFFLLRKEAPSAEARQYQSIVKDLAAYADEDKHLETEEYERLLRELERLSDHPPPELDEKKLISLNVSTKEDFVRSYERYRKLRHGQASVPPEEKVIAETGVADSGPAEGDGSPDFAREQQIAGKSEALEERDRAESVGNVESKEPDIGRRQKPVRDETVAAIFYLDGRRPFLNDVQPKNNPDKREIFVEINGKPLDTLFVENDKLFRTESDRFDMPPNHFFGLERRGYPEKLKIQYEEIFDRGENKMRIDWPGTVAGRRGHISFFVSRVPKETDPAPPEWTVDLDLSDWKANPEKVFGRIFSATEDIDSVKVNFSGDRFWHLDLGNSGEDGKPRGDPRIDEDTLNQIFEKFYPPDVNEPKNLEARISLKLQDALKELENFVHDIDSNTVSHFERSISDMKKHTGKQTIDLEFFTKWSKSIKDLSKKTDRKIKSKYEKEKIPTKTKIYEQMKKILPVTGFEEDREDYEVKIEGMDFSVKRKSSEPEGLFLAVDGDPIPLEEVSKELTRRARNGSGEDERSVPTEEVGKKYERIESIEIWAGSFENRKPAAILRIDE